MKSRFYPSYRRNQNYLIGFFALLLLPWMIYPQGKVYLVLGSDTAIWDAMDTDRYQNTYNQALFTNRQMNAYAVMDETFRTPLRDSFGRPVRLTWWMMGGQIFRYATNTNMPVNNTMTPYLMQKYHGAAIRLFGDEVTIHYHTFAWSDYNHDGLWWWNQAQSFSECRTDFDETLAMYLLEESIFPTSFRSGWHYMDNIWQARLNELLPYSLHNDYPSKKNDPSEPTNNNIDWSQASPEFVPYHPSPTNYQLAGDSKGWNVRSKHLGNVTRAMMDTIFAKANRGIDQVACFWGHLPETDFLLNIKRVDSLAHLSAGRYPNVKFLYCSATEAMQLWQKSTDEEPPQISIDTLSTENSFELTIASREPLFQPHPFIAYETLYEEYAVVQPQLLAQRTWRAVIPLNRSKIAKIGIAATDTVGNLTKSILKLLPDIAYLDDQDSTYFESRGTWTTTADAAWGTTGRSSILQAGDSVEAGWNYPVPATRRYNIYVQTPKVANPAPRTQFVLRQGDSTLLVRTFSQSLQTHKWIFIGNVALTEGKILSVKLSASGANQSGKTAAIDALKITPLVRERELTLHPASLTIAAISLDDSLSIPVTLYNGGISSLKVQSISSRTGVLSVPSLLEFSIAAMDSEVIEVRFNAVKVGTVFDTLIVHSDDPIHAEIAIPFSATVKPYFVIIDNEDPVHYGEYGNWVYSVAQAYGGTSRYCALTNAPGSFASFTTQLHYAGTYDIEGIVPTTVNAAVKALYLLTVNNQKLDSLIINQNTGSGSWVRITRRFLPANQQVILKIIDPGLSDSVFCLRADAIRFQIVEGLNADVQESGSTIPSVYSISQNYPNPFNPTTTIRFSVPEFCRVKIRIFDLLGRELGVVVDRDLSPGTYVTQWTGGQSTSSGTYFYRIEASTPQGLQYQKILRMVLLR